MATDIIARGMITEYKSGTNINFAENDDGSVTISASGSVSSEDSVARDTINNHKLDKNNPHNVTAEQIGLGNVDNTSDLDKPISTAVQQAIDNKADKTVATTSADGLMSASDKGKLDAFEITTTGGKLHDKDIATTDLIPTSLPANGGNADTVDGLHANEIATNPNLLINPDFKINQRGNTDFSVSYHTGSPIPQSQVYTVDRWRIMDGRANISNGKFTLTGTIIQVLENSIGSDFTATVSVESGPATASSDDSTKTFSIVGNNAVLNWAKLEYGSVATPFVSPDTATELLKCQRYFYKYLCNNIQGSIPSTCFNGCVRATVHLPTCMRTTPSLKIISAGYVYNDSGYISLENSGLFVYGMVGNYLTIKSANIVSINKDCAAVTSDCDFEFDAEIY